MAYAEDTTVTVAGSKQEIGRILSRYGAGAPMIHETDTLHTIVFQHEGRMIRMRLPLPAPVGKIERFYSPTRRRQLMQERLKQQKEVRRRYRALVLVLKAKLEAIASGIATVDEEFLSQIVTRSGQTVGEVVGAQMTRVLEENAVPMLPPGR